MVVTQIALNAFGGDRFELLIAAAYRARQISHGSPSKVENKDNHKPSVVALMEIEQGLYTKEDFINDRKPKTEKDVANEHFTS